MNDQEPGGTKQRRCGSATLAIVAAVGLGLTACASTSPSAKVPDTSSVTAASKTPTEVSAPAAEHGGQTGPDPCALLSASSIESVLGPAVKTPTSSEGPTGDPVCESDV